MKFVGGITVTFLIVVVTAIMVIFHSVLNSKPLFSYNNHKHTKKEQKKQQHNGIENIDIYTDDLDTLDQNVLPYQQRHLTGNDETCDNNPKDIVAMLLSSSSSVDTSNVVSSQVNDGEEEDPNPLQAFFSDIKSMFSRLFGGLFKRLQEQQDQFYEDNIPTSTILPLLSNYSVKFNSLANNIRQGKETNEAVVPTSNLPDILSTIFDLSAENMESFAKVLDPIVTKMSQKETMSAFTISCSVTRLVTYLKDDTIPNIVSLTEILSVVTNNDQLKDAHTKVITSSAYDTFMKSNLDASINRCFEENDTNDWMFIVDSETAISTKDKIDNLSRQVLTDDSPPFLNVIIYIGYIIGLIILFPISIVVSVLTILFVVPIVLLSIITNISLDFGEDDDGLGAILIFLGALFGPIIIIYFIILAIANILTTIINIFIPDQSPSSPAINEVMYRLGMVLESPMENIVETVQNMYTTRNNMLNDNDETELDNELNTLLCKNDALINDLPF